MQILMSFRSRRTLTALAASAVLSLSFALSACGTAGGTVDSSKGAATAESATEGGTVNTAAGKAIETLANLSGERLAIADKVAASKWGTDKPIEDPAREKLVLEDVAKRATDMGIDQETAERIFRDQIEANKVVQHGLYQRWEASPEGRPTTRPDLAKEIRPAIDRIGGELLTAIRDAQPLLTSPQCKASVERARNQTATSTGLDALHKEGLARALLHACP